MPLGQSIVREAVVIEQAVEAQGRVAVDRMHDGRKVRRIGRLHKIVNMIAHDAQREKPESVFGLLLGNSADHKGAALVFNEIELSIVAPDRHMMT